MICICGEITADKDWIVIEELFCTFYFVKKRCRARGFQMIGKDRIK